MFEAYSIGVRISLINNASAGLVALSQAFMRTHGDAEKLEARVKSIQGLLMNGGLLATAGGAMLGSLSAPLEEAKKYQTELARFQSLGFGDAINTQADKYARGMQTIGTSTRDNLMLLGDAMAVFKDIHHAEIAAPIMARMKFGNEALYGAAGAEANERKFMDMLKVIEFRGGLSSDSEFSAQANYVQKVIAGSRNRVDASQMLQALKTGGVALSRRENEAFYLGGEPLIQEFGGSRYGTAAMSVYQNLVQARGTITAQQELYRLGLLDPSMVKFNKLGQLKKALPGAFKGSEILERRGELALLEEVLLPAFSAKGITSEEDVLRELGMILGNRTGSSLMSRVYQQRRQLHIQSEANRHAMGIDEMAAAGGKNLAGQEIDLHKKFSTLLQNLGETVLPLAIAGLERLIPAIKGVSDWIDRHRTLTKALAVGFIALGAAMAIGGTLMMVTAAFRGLGLVIGIAPTLFAAARGIGVFAKLVAFSTVGGPGGIAAIGTSLSSVAGALGLITQAVGVFMAAYAGWKAGGWLNDNVINPAIQKATGDKNDTYGTALYEKFHPFNPKTGKREFSVTSAIWGNSDSLKQNRELEANYHRLYDLGSKKYLSADEAMAKDRESKSALGKDMDAVLKFGSPYIARGQNQTVQVTTNIEMDGRKVAKAVTEHQVKGMSAPQRGTSGFDASQMPTPIGIGSM